MIFHGFLKELTRIPRPSRPAVTQLRRLSGEDGGRPLDGIRVLDLSRVLAGPFATMILGDLGAEVIKVERPGLGDETRRWGPPFANTESVYFLSVNRNKKSVAINLKHPKGVTVVKELARVSDVLVENYVPGKLSKLGLGYEQLREDAPRLIYCSITGYGQTGPYVQRGGIDTVAAAVSGFLHISGPEGGDPVRPGVAMTDLATGLFAHGSIMAALLQRARTGRGQHLDCNLLSSQVACLSHVAANFLTAGAEATRWGTAHKSIVPYQAFKTQDGYLVIGATNNDHFVATCEFRMSRWASLKKELHSSSDSCSLNYDSHFIPRGPFAVRSNPISTPTPVRDSQVMSLPEVARDARFATNELRVRHRKELVATLADRFAEKTTAQWMALFEGCPVPYGPINSMRQVFSDPQVLHNGLIQHMDHPTAGHIAVPGPPVRYGDHEEGYPAVPPPLLGEHTGEVLTRLLGYSDAAVAELSRDGAVSL
ncbi:succinate--hydroxymethylglutarate CoA-transferase isoform X1 [Lethenteron reissneri]|uniref:succinate--hydroxymethylglutarate CoA-transferase isoform X1 n=1 Tax=Lethenteron reissneri TaxID=7753 RepID=UPI002AB77C98|nr:succinate--hydroxymethylglutarate CoA-transferase isoform X1 [Lethenteron reissneri]